MLAILLDTHDGAWKDHARQYGQTLNEEYNETDQPYLDDLTEAEVRNGFFESNSEWGKEGQDSRARGRIIIRFEFQIVAKSK